MKRALTKLHLFVFACFLLLVAPVATGERIPLWPEGKIPFFQPHQIAAMTDEADKPGFKPEEHRMPYLEWMTPPAPEKKTDACMVLISGGGYFNCCDVGLVAEWNRRLTAEGIQCVNLVYRTPRPKGLPVYASAWADGQRAIRLVRREAAKRGFNPEKIGVISMSAGSHLATLLATSSQTPAYEKVDAVDETPCHINWACPFAIAYALTDGQGCPNTRQGDAVDVRLGSEFKFDAKTCPMWLSHGGVDEYSPFASTLVYRKLRELKVPAELHLYPNRPHSANGLDRAIEFIHQMNFTGRLGPQVKLYDRYTNDTARADYQKEDIWPAGRMPDVQTNQCKPYLEWHFPKMLKTRAIQIIYSGGAYWGNGPDSFEVTPIRRYLNEKGMTVVTIKYRVPRPGKGLAKHTTAWQDLQRAIRIVKQRAPQYSLDPNRVGIMGSSAGGHLTLMGATTSRRRSYLPIDELDRIACNVNWAIAVYPAYVLTDGVDGGNKYRGNRDEDRLVRDFSFDLDTPPIFFIHGDSDVYSSMGSVKCWEQLARMGIQGELHTLALRDHCFQREASPGTGSYSWMEQIEAFLVKQGAFK